MINIISVSNIIVVVTVIVAIIYIKQHSINDRWIIVPIHRLPPDCERCNHQQHPHCPIIAITIIIAIIKINSSIQMYRRSIIRSATLLQIVIIIISWRAITLLPSLNRHLFRLKIIIQVIRLLSQPLWWCLQMMVMLVAI